MGIAKEHLPRIFDQFFTTKRKGSGLGLATSYSIICGHDGHIEVESEFGRGTTVRIYMTAVDTRAHITNEMSRRLHKGKGDILIMNDEEFSSVMSPARCSRRWGTR